MREKDKGLIERLLFLPAELPDGSLNLHVVMVSTGAVVGVLGSLCVQTNEAICRRILEQCDCDLSDKNGFCAQNIPVNNWQALTDRCVVRHMSEFQRLEHAPYEAILEAVIEISARLAGEFNQHVPASEFIDMVFTAAEETGRQNRWSYRDSEGRIIGAWSLDDGKKKPTKPSLKERLSNEARLKIQEQLREAVLTNLSGSAEASNQDSVAALAWVAGEFGLRSCGIYKSIVSQDNGIAPGTYVDSEEIDWLCHNCPPDNLTLDLLETIEELIPGIHRLNWLPKVDFSVYRQQFLEERGINHPARVANLSREAVLDISRENSLIEQEIASLLMQEIGRFISKCEAPPPIELNGHVYYWFIQGSHTVPGAGADKPPADNKATVVTR